MRNQHDQPPTTNHHAPHPGVVASDNTHAHTHALVTPAKGRVRGAGSLEYFGKDGARHNFVPRRAVAHMGARVHVRACPHGRPTFLAASPMDTGRARTSPYWPAEPLVTQGVMGVHARSFDVLPCHPAQEPKDRTKGDEGPGWHRQDVHPSVFTVWLCSACLVPHPCVGTTTIPACRRRTSLSTHEQSHMHHTHMSDCASFLVTCAQWLPHWTQSLGLPCNSAHAGS